MIVGVLYLGDWPFLLVLALIAALGQVELYALMKRAGLRPLVRVGLAIGALMVLRVMVPAAFLLALLGVVLIVATTALRGGEHPLADAGATIFGIVYPTAFLSLLVDIRLAPATGVAESDLFYLTLSILLLIWTTDTAAYFVGRVLGRRPLAQRVSPRKTWEGAIGGALGAFVVAVVLRLTLLPFASWVDLVVIALLCGAASQVGDLAESAMKRSVGAKDSGSLLPGHGGVLDRIDALVFVAPLVYIYVVHISGLLT